MKWVKDALKAFDDFKNKQKKCMKYCVESVQIQSYLWSIVSPNAGKYGPEITPYLGTFHAVKYSF